MQIHLKTLEDKSSNGGLLVTLGDDTRNFCLGIDPKIAKESKEQTIDLMIQLEDIYSRLL